MVSAPAGFDLPGAASHGEALRSRGTPAFYHTWPGVKPVTWRPYKDGEKVETISRVVLDFLASFD